MSQERFTAMIMDVKVGDIVHFKNHSICVEEIHKPGRGRRMLTGRISTGACEIVRRWYFDRLHCEIERKGGRDGS